jgi:hypothetical protein
MAGCRRLLLLAALCTQHAAAAAGARLGGGWHASELPSPDQSPAACGRPHRSSVCDPDGLLSSADADALDGILSAIFAGSRAEGGYADAPACGTKPKGYELAVAVVRRAGPSPSPNKGRLCI